MDDVSTLSGITSGQPTFARSQKRMTDARRAYAIHLLLSMSPIEASAVILYTS